MITLTERCEGLKIQATDCGDVDPPDTFGRMPTGSVMRKWRVTLRYEGRRMTADFYMGMAHGSTKPKAAEVMDCLLLDASSYDSAESYADWCYSLGMSPDDRRSRHTHTAVQKQTARLKNLLGAEFETWLYDTENDQ